METQMYEEFSQTVVSDKEMKEVMEKGKRVVTRDSHIEVTSYLYNGRVYVYDVKEIEK